MKSGHASALSNVSWYSLPVLFSFFLLQISILYVGISIHPLLILGIPAGLFLFWWLICNPGFSLLLMALAGIIKGFLIENVPAFAVIDYTLLFASLVWFGVLKLMLEGKWKIPSWARRMVLIHGVFCLLLGLSGVYTPSPEYGLLKIMKFLLFTSMMFVVPLVTIKDQKDSLRMLRHFKAIVAIVAIAMAAQVGFMVATGNLLPFFMRVSFLGANPIEVARFLAMGAAIIMVILIRQPGKNMVILLPGLLLVIVGLISTGSRGPMISLFLGIIFYGLFFETQYRKRLAIYTLIAVGLAVIALFTLPESLAGRFLKLSAGDVVVASSGFRRLSTVAMRFRFWDMSVSEWISSLPHALFGLGAGGFSSLFIWRDFRWYPHNMFVEVLVELGIVGFFTFVIFWIVTWKNILKGSIASRLTDHSALWVAVTLVRFFAAQLSGDVSDNRVLWMLMAITMASVSIDCIKANRRNAEGPLR